MDLILKQHNYSKYTAVVVVGWSTKLALIIMVKLGLVEVANG